MQARFIMKKFSSLIKKKRCVICCFSKVSYSFIHIYKSVGLKLIAHYRPFVIQSSSTAIYLFNYFSWAYRPFLDRMACIVSVSSRNTTSAASPRAQCPLSEVFCMMSFIHSFFKNPKHCSKMSGFFKSNLSIPGEWQFFTKPPSLPMCLKHFLVLTSDRKALGSVLASFKHIETTTKKYQQGMCYRK